jgi:hypothetical protein
MKALFKMPRPGKGLNVRQQTAPVISSGIPVVRAPLPDDDSISSGGIRLPQSNVGFTSEKTKTKGVTNVT